MTLYRVGWRHLFRHPWQTALMILGITLGVAVAVAVDLANASASRAFDLSTETIAGKASHQIIAGPTGLDQELYVRLRQSGLVRAAAPVITAYLTSPQLGQQPLQLLGLDPFADAPFRSYLGNQNALDASNPASANQPSVADLAIFLTRPGAILISQTLAERYDLNSGETIELQINGQPYTATISGLLAPSNRLSQRALDGLILADISTAQELTGRIGQLDRIDLILPEDPAQPCTNLGQQPAGCLAALQAFLPAGAQLVPVEARQGAVEQMTSAFRVNLTALSLLALVVGMFLIYNTMTFSVVQRRPLFGTLRCLGITRREVFGLVLSEALVAGLLGASLGLGLGVLMGQGAVGLVTQTITDLFFVVTVRGIQVPPESLLKGFLLGLLATLFSAAPPAWEAATVPARAALSRSGLESKAVRAVSLAAWAGGAMILGGVGLLLLPTQSLLVSFIATFAIIVGFAMLAPLATKHFMLSATPGLGRLWGVLGRMAPRNVVNSLSRTSIAVMSLMIAVSVTIGVSLMVGSFRQTIITWLNDTLQGDIYISAPNLSATAPTSALDPTVIEQIKGWPGVARVDVLGAVSVESPQGPVQVSATDNSDLVEERNFLSTSAPEEELWQEMTRGAILVSEPFANLYRLPRRGGEVALYTSTGLKTFPVAGIYYDYASTQGTILMALPVYQQNWNDTQLSALALRLAPEVIPDQTVTELQDAFAGQQRLLIRSNQALRQEVLEVFDRTFAITGALQLLTTGVAFIGVLSALLSLELERQRELGILRSIGLTVRQMWNLVLLETGLMGVIAGLLAMPTGFALSLILIYIINRRSFGWTLQLQLDPQPFIAALLLATGAALLAGIYPALRMGRMVASEALRSE
jgi:putative ABC transport system permease protein